MAATNLPRNLVVVELDNDNGFEYEENSIPADSGLGLENFLKNELLRLCSAGDLREGQTGKIGARSLILLFEISHGGPVILSTMPSKAFIDDFNKNVPG